MVGTSKILTVSYGTFSCTLEGFDDSFETMKAIAEYFRDLAADDRYFGAEPPSPDAEMLARIAEREVQKRVEARITDSSVVLRAKEDTQPEEQAAAAPAIEPEPVEYQDHEVPSEPAPVVDVQPEEIEEPTVSPAVTAEPAVHEEPTESVAQKLQRIRAVVAKNQAEPSGYAEDQHAEVAGGEAAPVDQAESTDTPEQQREAAKAFFADVAETSAPAEYEDEAVDAADAPAPVAVETFEDEEFEEVLEEVESASDALKDDAEEVEAVADETSAEPVEAVQEDVQEEDETPVADVATGDNRIVKMRKEALETLASRTDEDKVAADTHPQEHDYIGMPEEASDDNAVEVSAQIADEYIQLAEVDDVELDEAASSTDEDHLIRELAEVEAVIDSHVEEMSSEQTEEPADDTVDLIMGLIDEDTSIEKSRAISERANRRVFDNITDDDGEEGSDVDRLLQETNTQLENPETSRRRSAISHLRAAVAATVADRLSSKHSSDDTSDDQDAYRADLAEVVRPRAQQPTTQGDRESERPETPPLMLVTEQRVDITKEAQISSPAPALHSRRISKGSVALREVGEEYVDAIDRPALEAMGDASNIFAADTTIDQFVEHAGATEYDDVLEAAAAYISYVEGQQTFRRPHLMSLASEVFGRRDFSREDGLRAFGQLLREERIVKVRRGQFEIADDNRFRPSKRNAAS